MRPLNDFIGLPFAYRGRSFQGVDCYGLVWLWHRECRKVELPDFQEQYAGRPSQATLANTFERGRQESAWKIIGTPGLGDVIFLRMNGLASHCGLVIGQNRFLHVTEQHDSCIEYWTNPIWAERVVGFYRYHGRPVE